MNYILQNQNTKNGLLFRFFDSCTYNIWQGTILVGYLSIITQENNFKIGITEAVLSIVNLIVSMIAQYVIRRYDVKKFYILRFACIFGMLFIFSGMCLFFDVFTIENKYKAVNICLIFCGLYRGVVLVIVGTLFTNSMETGRRMEGHTWESTAIILGRMSGPMINIFLLSIYGNSWNLETLKICAGVGISSTFICIIILLQMNDKFCLDQNRNYSLVQSRNNNKCDARITMCCGKISQMSIPYFIFACDFFHALGTGMTNKYFPLFFKFRCGLTPVHVNVLYLLLACLQFLNLHYVKYISTVIGRMWSGIIWQTICVSAFTVLTFLRNYWDVWYVVAPLWLLRKTFGGSWSGIRKSVLMDYVQPQDRIFWLSLDAIRNVGWSGTAVLGGFLIDHYGYGETFIFTAGLQYLGTLFWTMILPLSAKIITSV